LLSFLIAAHVTGKIGVVPAARTARARARAELTEEIKTAARCHLAEAGAAALSLRAVSRELGMVSSALYRYFPSRDDLLTALIVDSYAALAAALRSADRGTTPRARWVAVCHALRDWAVQHPHEYSLIYGTPVPGYRAPRDTVQPAADVLLILVNVLRDAEAAGLQPVPVSPLSRKLAAQLRNVQTEYAEGVSLPVLARLFQAFGQLIGTLTLELFGHFVGSLDPSGPFYELTVTELADRLGLPVA